jgi:circadian clock protein KaiB
MSSNRDGAVPAGAGETEGKLVLRLFITRGASNSIRALTNVRAVLEQHFAGRYSLEVVDLLEDPLRAFADDILVTPTLIKLWPLPRARMAGNLSQTERVLAALTGSGALEQGA